MIDLRYVLREAWRLSWRHKRLWLLGIAASLGIVRLRTGLSSRSMWARAALELPSDVGSSLLHFLESPYLPVLVVLIGILVLAGASGLTVLNAVGRAALVDQVRAAEEGGAVELRAGWAEGKRRLWAVFSLRLILGLPALLVAATVGLFLLLATAAQWAGTTWPTDSRQGQVAILAASSLCLTPVAGVLLVISVPLNVLLRLAVRANMFEGLGVRESIQRAWATARQHWGAVIVIWMVQMVVTFVALVMLGFPLLLGSAALSTGAVAVGFVSLLWSIGLAAIVSLAGWLAGGALGGVIETFASAMWTLAYREMHGLGKTGEVP